SGWSVLRYSTLSCLTGTLTALFFVLLFSAFGKIDVPEFKAIWTVKYHMLFMITFPGLLALLSWNKGVQILQPINAILFINLAPVTTLMIRFIQGYQISLYEISGVSIVCLMIILNNLHQRYQKRKIHHVRKKELIASSFIIMKLSCPLKEQLIFHYNPHFNWAPQLVHVLHPPISATCPSRHTGQRSPASDPTATFVFSSS